MKDASVCDGIEHIRSDKDFTHIHNEIIRDKRIDFATKGVFLTLWSLPDTWEFRIDGLKKCFGGSNDMWVRTLNKLAKFGYIRKEAVKRDDHNCSTLTDHFKYILCDKPSKTDKTVRDSEIRNSEKRNSENRRQTKTNNINIKLTSGGGTPAHAREIDSSVSCTKTERANVRRLQQPTPEEFYAWQKRMVKKFAIQVYAIDACSAAYRKAVERGWKTPAGIHIANWKKYFSQILLSRDSQFWRESNEMLDIEVS